MRPPKLPQRMSSYNSTTGEGSTNPSSPSSQATTLSTYQPPNQDTNTSKTKTEKTEQNGKKRKRSKRDRLSDNPTSDNKPRRERANFNAAQLYALERLFHDQKYPDGELRAKIASRLDMNEERVQIWFQNRRAKHKRSQRECGSAPPSSELSPGLAFGLQPPSSVDEYIPPQLDEEMFGPGPCTMQVLPHQVTTASLQATDQIPGVLAVNPKCQVNGGPAITFSSRDNNFGHPHQSNGAANQSKSEWPQSGNRDLEMFSPVSTDGMLCNTKDLNSHSVGKFTGFEPVEFPPSTVNYHMNETDVTACIHGPPVSTMCPTVDEPPWNTASRQKSVVQSKIIDSKTTCIPVQHPFTKTVQKSSQHSGETPCHKDSKCLTCREKPPPNQICTALPHGERNELDEALYRCAVGSIFGIRSLTPRPTAEHPIRTANPSAADTPSVVVVSVDDTKLVQSKTTKNSKENTFSSQRRMALARKQRQLEAGYLSSSSDSSSDAEGETQRRRRRKCARTSEANGAPPNRVCTAVPLLDRTLPLPCLTKDLDLDSYLEGDKTLGAGELLAPTGGFPSCMPSPLSLDRLSSPEPRSSPSEPPEYSSSSSSDLSDFEYIPPLSATSRSLPSTVTTAFTPRYDFPGRKKVDVDTNMQRGRGGQATNVAANNHGIHSLPKQDGGSTVRCRTGPPQVSCIQPPSCSYATGGRAVAPDKTNFNRHDGVLSSIPPPFVMQLDPATLSSSDNSGKQIHIGIGASSSACDEKRKNHNCEVLAESRVVGEMCSNSPDSPWSDSGSLHSPYFNQTSPQTDQLYPRLPSDAHPSSFHPHSSHSLHASPYESSIQTLTVSNGISPHVNHNDVGFTGMTSKHLQFPRHNQPINSQPVTCHYPPMTQNFGTPMYNPPIGVHPTYGGGNGGESYRVRLPMRSLERAPVAMGAPMPQNGTQFTQSGYSLNCRPRIDTYRHFNPSHPPPNRSCMSATDSSPINPQQKTLSFMGNNQSLPFSRLFSDNY